jgi:hypothetical protein
MARSMTLAHTHDIRLRSLARVRMADAIRNARPDGEVTREINQLATTRLGLYRQLAEIGADEWTREQVATLARRLDFLYEELRISRMVAA